MKTKLVEGFGRVLEFQDAFGAECSLNLSSNAVEECVWLGVDKPPLGAGEKYTRMHLSRKQAAELLPFLERFVQTGDPWERP